MDFKEYSEKALRTAPMYETIYDQIDNAILGLSGETGEVADIFKKFKYQGHELNTKEMALETSDICWYINLILDAIGYTWEQVLAMNIEKLEKRYPTGAFRIQDSINRVE